MESISSIKKVSIIVGCCILGLWSAGSFAAVASPGPAPASYGSATHATTNWQELNDITNVGDSYGVTWSIDGGATWGHNNLQVGQTVQFKFDMRKQFVGTHYADHLKAWLDWNQNGVFDDGEVIAYGEHILRENEPWFNVGSYNTPWVSSTSFYSDEYEITDSFVGDLWLRARVTCSESLVGNRSFNSFVDFESEFKASGHLWQGETEDWRLHVAPVPIPAAVWLFGSGLAGMIGFSKRKQAA